MRLSRQFQDNLFFLRKDFEHTKSIKTQNKQLPPLLCAKNYCLCCFLFTCFFGFFCWLVLSCFAFLNAQHLFVKKKKLAWNCPDNLIYYASDVYPYQPAYRQFICTHLFLYVIICESFFFLWESFLSVRISSYCKNLCHLCESVSLWKQACVWIPSFETNILSSKYDNDILLISYVPISCFLLWILFILCLIIFLLTKCLYIH